ncbi:MAG: hypothetical protein VYE40_04800 [Myxococcota bacterium]|nr:hypothetical protein [Myxococcota bacterium]
MSRLGVMLLVWGASLALVSCAGGKKNEKKDEDQGDPSAFLDDPVEKRPVKPKKMGVVMIPSAPSEVGIELDGKPTGWDLDREARVFDDGKNVEDGGRMRSGASDASMRVAMKADEGYLYFWLESFDDVIIEDDDRGGLPVDGLVLWLRDPGLERVANSLPEGTGTRGEIVTDLALLFTPDGRVRRYDSTKPFEKSAVRWVPFKTDKGWGVELAIAAEVFPHVHSFPIEQIAFRVELLDGDDTKRPGVQTRMSMLPDQRDGSPRFAIADTGGILPHGDAVGDVSLPDPIGFWTRGKEKQWNFTSIEHVPRLWRYLQQDDAFREQISKDPELDRVCNLANFDRHLVDVLESRSKRHRVGLMVCAAREVKGSCKGGAKTRLYWLHYVPDGTGWFFDEATDVLGADLPQCYREANKGKPLHTNFSLLPLEFYGSDIWLVGFKRALEERDYTEETLGAWIMNSTRKKGGLLREVVISRTAAEGRERLQTKTSSYFVQVDGNKGLDMCELERADPQTCASHNQGCRNYERGGGTEVHLHTWQPDKQKFDRYMLSKHPRCKHDFDFSRREGFLLLHTGTRVGLLPSVAND